MRQVGPDGRHRTDGDREPARRPTSNDSRPERRAPAPETGSSSPRSLLELQRTIGNRAVGHVLQRFTAADGYDFAGADRASLPPSVELLELPGNTTDDKYERHHVIGDRSILQWLGKKEAGEEVPINKWSAAALKSEVDRAGPAMKEAHAKGMDETKLARIQMAVDKVYVPLQEKFGAGPEDEKEPSLDQDEIENLLCVLEWTPNNFVIDSQARLADPGDMLDFEALLLKKDPAMRTLLLRLAIAMGQLSEANLKNLDATFANSKYKDKWAELRANAKGSAKVSDLFAQLVTMAPSEARGKMKRSPNKQKQKFKNAKDWEAGLLKSFATD